MRSKIIFLGVFFFINNISNAQVSFNWAKGIGAIGSDEGTFINVDAAGNVYTSGTYDGTVDFDPGAGVSNLNPDGTYNVYLNKLDASGNFVWAKGMGFTAISYIEAIAIDNSNNIYITGSFQGTGDFDPGVGVTSLTTVGGADIFICKFDNAGNFLWVKQIGDIGNEHSGSIALDNTTGDIVIAGYFNDSTDFDSGAGVATLTSLGGSDAYVCKLDASGNFMWVKHIGGTGSQYAEYIAIGSSGDVYVTGNFQDSVDFDPGVGVSNIISVGSADIYVSKFDDSGNFVWAKSAGGTSIDYGRAISLDIAGNIYVTGNFYSTVDFDPSAGVSNVVSSGSSDIYIWKLDALGNFVWAKGVGSPTGFDSGRSISVDAFGNAYASGNYYGTGDFDPGAGVYNLTATGIDAFIIKLDATGNLVWVHSFGGTYNEVARSCKIDASGNIYAVGDFGTTVDFDPTTNTSNLISGGSQDIYILKWHNSNVGIGNQYGSSNEEINTSVFPNPSNGVFTLSLNLLSDSNIQIDIFDIAGKNIYSKPTQKLVAGDNSIAVVLSNLANGIYFIKVYKDASFKVMKLIISK